MIFFFFNFFFFFRISRRVSLFAFFRNCIKKRLCTSLPILFIYLFLYIFCTNYESVRDCIFCDYYIDFYFCFINFFFFLQHRSVCVVLCWGGREHMFHLLYGLWKILFKKDEYRVMLIGVDNAGKSTVLERIKAMHGIPALPPSKICPTVGLNIGRLDLQSCKLLLWDLGGQKSLRAIWDRFSTQAHAVVFIVDAAVPKDDPKWDEVRESMSHILSTPHLSDKPILIFNNKIDQHSALSTSEIVGIIAGSDPENGFSLNSYFKQSKRYRMTPCCALNGENIIEGLNWLVNFLQVADTSPM